MGALTVAARRCGTCRFVVEDGRGGAVMLSGGPDLERDLRERGNDGPPPSKESTDMSTGLRPMHALLGSIAVCGALDVLVILAKQRESLADLTVIAEGERPDTMPAPFSRVRLRLETHSRVDPGRLLRAAELAYSKYCSVRETLSSDIPVEISVRVDERDTLD